MKGSPQPTDQFIVSRAGRNRRLFTYTAIAVATALAMGGISAIAKTSAKLPETSPLAMEQSTVRVSSSFANLIQSVQPAVVNITVDAKTGLESGAKLPDSTNRWLMRETKAWC